MNKAQNKTKLEPARVYSMAELVDYSEGAIVSRTIIKNQAGTVTLFAFDEGQALSEHSTPFDALVQVLDGEVELVIGGETILATTGANAHFRYRRNGHHARQCSACRQCRKEIQNAPDDD